MIDPTDKSTEGFYLDKGSFASLPSESGSITFRMIDLAIRF